jgi:hypothetical protein
LNKLKKKLWKKSQFFWEKFWQERREIEKERGREREREREREKGGRGVSGGRKENKRKNANHVRVVAREAFVVAAMPTNRQNPNGMQIAYDDDEWNWRG